MGGGAHRRLVRRTAPGEARIRDRRARLSRGRRDLHGQPAGLLTYRRDGDEVEIAYLEVSMVQGGVGTRLLEAVAEQTLAARLWLVTTNDNLDALRFYQRRGFTIAEVRPGAVDEARRTLKPAIREVGRFGIPVHDEIVLERFSF